MIVRLQNNALGRMLHASIYDRMLAFAKAVNPEIPAEGVIEGWLDRLYKDDERLHILVNLDDRFTIVEHAVIDVQIVGGRNAVVCHQVFRDRPNLETFKQGLAYIDALVKQTRSVCSAVYVQKYMKALEKVGYKTIQVLMIKCNENEDTESVEGNMPSGIQEIAQATNGVYTVS